LWFGGSAISFPSWKQEDCFPIIRDTILQLCEKKKSWVLLDEIVNALLENGTVLEFVSGVDVWRDEEAREILANMVAWFSQKITEYENGTLPDNYRQIDLIEEVYTLFDRREIEGRYAYKLRAAPDVVPEVKGVKVTKRSTLIEKRVEERKRQEEFRKFVEDLKREKVTPEEYRKRIMKWQQKANDSN